MSKTTDRAEVEILFRLGNSPVQISQDLNIPIAQILAWTETIDRTNPKIDRRAEVVNPYLFLI